MNAAFFANQPAIFGTVNEDYVKRELEWYNSKYITDRSAIKEDYGYEILEPTVYNNAEIGFFPSSLTTDIFYRYLWIVSDKFNLGTRISLGTNLYSDWDQFKKYAWLGLGLELGFGKVKASKVKP
jgi:hypothetical protein